MSTSTNNDSAASAIPYRSVSVIAVWGAVVSLFSILSVFHWIFWLIPVVVILLGWKAIRQVRHAPQEYLGVGLAYGSMVLAVVLAVVGSSIYSYILRNTVPTGYKLLTWESLKPDPKKKTEIIPPDAYDLQPNDDNPDRRVFITGYMMPGKRMLGLKDFILVPTVTHCQTCQSNLKSTDMIYIVLTGNLKIDYTDREIKVGGKFRVDQLQVLNPYGGLPYQIDADFLLE